MRRYELNGRLVVDYLPGDRIVVSIDGEHRKGAVKYVAELAGRYGVLLDGEKYTQRISAAAVVKQADTGSIDVMGKIEHVEKF